MPLRLACERPGPAFALPDAVDSSLLAGLHAADPAARRRAARDLGSDPAGHPQSVAMLADRLVAEQQRSVRDVIVTAMTRIASTDAADALARLLDHHDAELRGLAAEALRQMPRALRAIMPRLLSSASADVRIQAISLLDALPDGEAETVLIAIIKRERDVNACAAAVDLLSQIGTSAAAAPLRRLRVRFANHPFIQFAAELALNRIGEGS